MRRYLRNCTNNLALYNLLLVLLVSFTSLTSCKNQSSGTTSEVVATFGEQNLLRSELDFFTPDSASAPDSVRFASEYIEQWIEDRAVDEAAKRTILKLDEMLKPKVEAYAHALREQAFTKWLLEENEDRFRVADRDIKDYYRKFPEKFISDQEYYQFFHISTSLEAQYQIVSQLRSTDQKVIDELIAYANESAETYKLDSTFVNGSELMFYSDGFYFGNIRKASKGNVYPYAHKINDTTYYDFFKMIDVIKEGETMPLGMVKDQIELIIQNQRKQALIEQYIARLVQEAKATQRAKTQN
ncbi:MAG: hypothetical protein AAF789_07985 [Bacteroidota bacterium]